MSVPSTALPASSAGSQAPLVVVTLLFFMWGLLTALNDVLIPHLKAQYTLSYLQAMLVQFCFFGAYFLVSLPAGRLIQRLGYQRGAVAGLMVASLGCLLFLPAAHAGYALFLFAFFVLAAGITVLQVAANPYVTALGDPRTASSRLTLTQAFNSLGTAVAPALGVLILPEDSRGGVQGPYLVLAIALLVLAALFALARLPRIADEAVPATQSAWVTARSHPHLLWGVMAIFLYVGAEVSIGSLLINFIEQAADMSTGQASPYLSLYWGGAMVGRFIGVALMRFMAPGRLLAVHAALAVALIAVGVTTHGAVAMWALLAVGLCNSIMFPTLFSMAVHGLGAHTAQASGLLCMAIVGGALLPLAQGHAADVWGLQASFGVPALCYLGIAAYGWANARLFQR
ncbi:MAG TPA: sugar MFS transporter [Roseateles sp.]